MSVLKDLNFKSKIFIDAAEREAFLQQIKVDCDLLVRCSIMDYSLLLGIHQPEDDDDDDDDDDDADDDDDNADGDGGNAGKGAGEGAGEGAAGGAGGAGGEVARNSSSASEGKGGDSAGDRTSKGPLAGLQAITAAAVDGSPPEDDAADLGYLSRWMQTSGGIEGRTPLWKREVYFLSIIDILQVYDLGKRAEHVVKGLKYSAQEISSVHAKPYADRFIQYIDSVTVGIEGIAAYKQEQAELGRRAAEEAEQRRQEALKEAEEQEAWLAAWRKTQDERKRAEMIEKRAEMKEKQEVVEDLERSEREFAVFCTKLQAGVKVIKHNRKGQPTPRVLWMVSGRLNVDVKNPLLKNPKVRAAA